MDRPVAMTTSRPAAGDNPRSKPSSTNQNDTASTSHEASVQRKATRPRRALRSAMKPCIKFLTAASRRSGKRNGKRESGRRAKRTGRSPKTRRTTTAPMRTSVNAIPRIPAARIQVTSGNQGSATNRSRRRARTSKKRSVTTVAAVSARDEPPRECKATIRAASPARSGKTLLKNWPISSAWVVGQTAGLVFGEKRTRQRSARMKNPSASVVSAGTRDQ
jgi:hypothetical protein